MSSDLRVPKVALCDGDLGSGIAASRKIEHYYASSVFPLSLVESEVLRILPYAMHRKKTSFRGSILEKSK
jgi:hypothetical protein